MSCILNFFSSLFTPCTKVNITNPSPRMKSLVIMPTTSKSSLITPSNTQTYKSIEKQQFDINRLTQPVTPILNSILIPPYTIPKSEDKKFLPIPQNIIINKSIASNALGCYKAPETSSKTTKSKRIKKTYNSLDQYIETMSELIRMDVKEEIKREQKKCVNVEIVKANPHEIRCYGRDNLYFFCYLNQNWQFMNNDKILLSSTNYDWETEAVVVANEKKKCYIRLNSIPLDCLNKFNIILQIDESENRLLSLLEQARNEHFNEDIISVVLGRNIKVEMEFYYQLKDYSTPFFKLNESQNNAVDNAMKYAVSLIQGPPGTGKTTTIMAIVYNLCLLCYGPNELSICFKKNYLNKGFNQFQCNFSKLNSSSNYRTSSDYKRYNKEIFYNKNHNILICAQRNIPITDIKNKLSFYGVKVLQVFAKSQEQNYQNEPHSLHFKFNKKLKNSLEYKQIIEKIHKYEIQNLVKDRNYSTLLYQKRIYEKNLKKNIIEKYKIICTTCISSANFLLKTKCFKHVIIDEATQALEAEVLICLMKGANHLILLGDSQQLGAVVKSEEAKNLGLDISLIDRLSDIGVPCEMLCEQRRMYPLIAEFPSEYFYYGKLKSAKNTLSLAPVKLPNNIKCNMMFYNIRSDEESIDCSYVNRIEAKRIVDIVKYLISNNVSSKQIGIITFYEKQRELIKKSFEGLNGCKNVEVLTVDGSQGREKEIVILSCVRANKRKNVGFVEDYRRLNVAMTRAQRCLIICGNTRTLKSSGIWSRLLNFMNEKKLIYSGKFDKLLPANLEIIVKGSFSPQLPYKYE
ncbi:hypothetical protein SteCoe_37695 [Stentor coeruleus]|uniref:Helicase ATP-binding domain-containing protein n=1 Tax=Stentor coeruleus TaxID=5963 RepID=A0A1R2AMJ8_9CILI|nr:hypothetical protein SteCoe_37695 [Stentor coeruleus]